MREIRGPYIYPARDSIGHFTLSFLTKNQPGILGFFWFRAQQSEEQSGFRVQVSEGGLGCNGFAGFTGSSGRLATRINPKP